ncbi:hypothetical protein ABTM75_19645, partial [Acinetobacter baumannii]
KLAGNRKYKLPNQGLNEYSGPIRRVEVKSTMAGNMANCPKITLPLKSTAVYATANNGTTTAE